MGIFDRGPFWNQARRTKSAIKFIDQYGINTLSKAKNHYLNQGMERPIMLNERMIREYISILEEHKTLTQQYKPPKQLEFNFN